MNSCNPVFVTVGLRLGADNYYRYFNKFGLLNKTNVDLPGEAGTIMHKLENIGLVELATISLRPVLSDNAHSACHNGILPDKRREPDYPHFGVETMDEEGNVTNTFRIPGHDRYCIGGHL